MKATHVGLWWIWLYGLILIGVYLIITNNHKLPSLPARLITNVIKRHEYESHDLQNPRIIIFSGPAPFTGSVGDRQMIAIRSWLALSSQVNVVLFSQHPSFASAFNNRVLVDNSIDFTFLGTPFFHSMVERSKAFSGDIFVFVESDTILLPDLVSTLNHVHESNDDWLLMASPQNISSFPFHLDGSGMHWITQDRRRVGIKELMETLVHNGHGNHCNDRMLIAWNNKNVPLHNGVLPPFLYGKGNHNHWIINEAMSAESRIVFDASLAISSFFIGHDVLNEESRKWEYIGNSLLAMQYGSSSLKETNLSNFVKVVKCGGEYLVLDMKQEIAYPFSLPSSTSSRKASHFVKNRKYMSCVVNFRQNNGISDCDMRNILDSLRALEFPCSLEALLSITADMNKTIVLAVAGYSYKDMLMSWVCRLRHLKVTNFLICALDQETYEFSVFQGLPVFYDPSSPRNISFDDCHFGTKCFQRVTKVKSRTVLRILKLGYNVLLSDVDVYWFRNPLPHLSSFGPAVLVAQSDEVNNKGPINLPRRLNSGFYFVHSDNSTIGAMEKVVKHAATSSLSEQPSFYDTLCGEGGSNRVGEDKCVEPQTNLTVHFLDRNLFPNGAYFHIWQEKNVKAKCETMGCVVLHNNWIPGRARKLERQVLSGLWEYDNSKRMCLQS